jgi:hypothetical protein
MKPKILEKTIQKAILDYLELRRAFYWRNNSGMHFFTGKNGKSAAMRMGKTGSPDIYILKNGKLIGLEVKGASSQSDSQKSFQTEFESNGGIYYIVRSVDEVQALGL